MRVPQPDKRSLFFAPPRFRVRGQVFVRPVGEVPRGASRPLFVPRAVWRREVVKVV